MTDESEKVKFTKHASGRDGHLETAKEGIEREPRKKNLKKVKKVVDRYKERW